MRPGRCTYAAGVLVVAVLTGCSPLGVTALRLEGSLAPTFARLYLLQRARQGHAPPDLAALHATARCQRGSPSSQQSGAGNDWICQVSFLADGVAAPVRALYSLDVHPDGCWAADGDGPASVNGLRTLTDTSGEVVVNPLYLVNGCFDGG